MPKFMTFRFSSAAAIGFLVATVPAVAYTGQGLARHAKIGMGQARAIALKAYPGTITDVELEYEKGAVVCAILLTFDTPRPCSSPNRKWQPPTIYPLALALDVFQIAPAHDWLHRLCRASRESTRNKSPRCHSEPKIGVQRHA